MVPTFWLANVSEVELMKTAAKTPFPVSGTDCRVVAALSVIDTEPVWLIRLVGVKVTVIVQVEPTGIDELQVLTWEKSPDTVALMEILVMFKAAAPVFFTVTTWGALAVLSCTLGNARVAGVRVTTGRAPTFPVPLRVTLCGPPEALSVIVIAADRLPTAKGENVTAMLQLKPAASLLLQLFVCEKSPLFVPVTAMLLMVRVVVPVLLKLMFCAALVVPAAWLAKVRLAGVSVTSGTALVMPIPERLTCRPGLLPPGALSMIANVAVRVPAADGVKVIRMVQNPPGDTSALSQPWFCTNSVPVMVTELMVTAVFP